MTAARTAKLTSTNYAKTWTAAPQTLLSTAHEPCSSAGFKWNAALIIGETIIPGAVSIEELQNVINRERAKQR